VITFSLDLNDEGALHDSGLDDSGPFSDTPPPGGVSLEAALKEFGPAAIDDLIPRLRALAADLDEAHAAGFVHGRLHPSKVVVTDEATFLVGRRASPSAVRKWPILRPYTAPEVVAGGAVAPAADQYSFAALAFEWMFGKPIHGPAERAIEVRSMPGVDRAALGTAFTRALAADPAQRFASCGDFCDAVSGSVTPALPLMVAADDDEDPVEPFLPEEPSATPGPDLTIRDSAGARASDTLRSAPGDAEDREPVVLPLTQPDLRPGDEPGFADRPTPLEQTVSRYPDPISTPADSPRFGGLALVMALVVGLVFGFAAGYMARPRALQHSPIANALEPEQGAPSRPEAASAESRRNSPDPARAEADAQGAGGAQGAPGAAAPGATGTAGATSGTTPPTSAPTKAPEAREGNTAAGAAPPGRLLVRSNPSGARVTVDGADRGVTPLTLRDLALGSRTIVITRQGFEREERRVVLTDARPSRSVEVRLSPVASSRPRPSTPATLGRPAATTGSLIVESVPAGASVTVNGKPAGVTPLTIEGLSPGEYRVTLTLAGYADVATTVRVVAGERARAAARLTERQENE
jgi:hypothetical protein